MTRRSCSSFPLVAWFSSAKRRVSSAQKKQIVKDRSRAEESGRKRKKRAKKDQSVPGAEPGQDGAGHLGAGGGWQEAAPYPQTCGSSERGAGGC